MFGIVSQTEQGPRRWIIVSTLIAVITVGVVDYAASPDISFAVFYLLAVGVAAWFVGRGFAYLVSVFSLAVSIAGDLAGGWRYSSILLPFWNGAIILAFYLIVVLLLTRLRQLTKGLEARVLERTLALTGEMAERERLERELLEVSEREQRRIGHDLHDTLGQHLTGTALAVRVLEGKLAARGLVEAADASKAVELIEDSIQLTRTLAKGLHPIEMEAEGLMQALEELAVTNSEMFRIRCHFECDSPVLIHDAVASGHLFRIAQEAVTNAVKHGKAKNVKIQLEPVDEGIALRIQDDGIGIPNPLPENRGMGLRIMAHRARISGASFEARREPTGGTTVECVWPQQPEIK